jgi:hypothetical protein
MSARKPTARRMFFINPDIKFLTIPDAEMRWKQSTWASGLAQLRQPTAVGWPEWVF